MPGPSMTSAAPPSVARPFAVLATVLPAAFMQVVDVSIVNVAIPSIQHQLGASYAEVQLVLAVRSPTSVVEQRRFRPSLPVS